MLCIIDGHGVRLNTVLFDPEHSSSPRNKLIAQVLYDIGLIFATALFLKIILPNPQQSPRISV